MVRHKNRYFVVEVRDSNGKSSNVSMNNLHVAILDKVQQLHGDFGVAAIKSGFTAKYCNSKTRISVIRVRRGPHRIVASVLPFIKYIDRQTCQLYMLYKGATIRHCYNFIKNYQQKKYEECCLTLKTDEEKEDAKIMLQIKCPVLETL